MKKGIIFESMYMYIIIFFIAMFVAYFLISNIYGHPKSFANRGGQIAQAVRYDLGTSINLLNFYAEDGRDGTIEYFYIEHKMNPASYAVHYRNVNIYFKSQSSELYYNYSDDINCSLENAAANISIYNESTLGLYGVRFQRKLPYTAPNVLAELEQAVICFRSPEPILHDDFIEMKMIPAIGLPFVLNRPTPQNINDKRIQIHPLTK